SLLLTLPIISLANRALTSCGLPPPASISSTTQYQFPTVSTATGDPPAHRLTKFFTVPWACANRISHTRSPLAFSTRAQVYFLCTSNAMYSITAVLLDLSSYSQPLHYASLSY